MDPVTSPSENGRRLFYFIVALVVVGLLAAIIVPEFVKGRLTRTRDNACVNNLRQIEGAKHSWSLEMRKSAGTIVTPEDENQINRYLKYQARPLCPAGGVISYGKVGEKPTCTVEGHSV